jgi:nitrite reductase/ring-hydroxylating ferredoxin subunit/DMSO/TMAO reductase YedYZ heme-binding membrane subunit
MSVGFRAVQWNRRKVVYDAILVAAVAIYIAGFMGISAWRKPPANWPDWINLRIDALGSCAFIMLTIILSIGPLARLDARFLPLLYNRRHFGVLTFFVAAVHGWSVVEWFWTLDALPSLGTELTNTASYGKFIGFPYKTLGIAALTVLLLLAATSHDFWLAFLTPPVWKAMHMLLYAAYGIVVMHVALGAMQGNRSALVPLLIGGAFVWVAGVHVIAGRRERAGDVGSAPGEGGWIAVGPPHAIPDKEARIVAAPGGERIAVFRDGARVGALTNLCAHQNGPLGEGRIIDGCITCPWHGFQYRLEDGRAPPPFTEVLATYPVRLRNGIIEVEPRPLPPGTPAAIDVVL